MSNWSRFNFRIEEAILVILIILETMDFLEVIPADLEFIEKIISWTALGLLLYQASLTRIFFGNRSKKLDIAIITTYFILIANKIAGYAISVIKEKGSQSYILPFSQLLVRNFSHINHYSFITGGILLIVLSILIGLKIRFNATSVVSIFHQEGYVIKKTAAKRIMVVFLILSAFFLTIFNLISEWLAIAADAPIFFIVALIYIFYIVRHKSQFKIDSFIYKLSNMTEEFYEDFIKQFKYKSTILLGMGGLLVLLLITDILNFIIPYIIKIRDPLYFSRLGQGHDPLITLLRTDLIGQGLIDSASIVFVYIMNILAILLLMIMPALLWYLIYNEKSIRISKLHLALLGLSLPSFFLAPSFVIKAVNKPALIGVDIQSISVLPSRFPISYVFLFSIMICLVVLALSYFRKIEKYIMLTFITISQGFFAYYIYYFYTDLSREYFAGIKLLSSTKFLFFPADYFSLFYMALFFAMITVFYIGGFIFFQYEIIKKLKHYIKF